MTDRCSLHRLPCDPLVPELRCVLLARLEALEICEWAGEDGMCPACDRYRESGHHEGCALAYALAGVRTALALEPER